MADFKVQRLTFTIPSSGTSDTLSAGGVDYDTPTGEAFVYVPGLFGGGNSTAFSGSPGRSGVRLTGSIGTSLTAARTTSTTSAVTVEAVIVEYIGAASGANEFEVLLDEVVNIVDTSLTVDTSSAGTPSASWCRTVTSSRIQNERPWVPTTRSFSLRTKS